MTSILRGWGIQCGVDPSGLTDDALLQAPPPFGPHEDSCADDPSDVSESSPSKLVINEYT